MKSKHTPGPWWAYESAYGRWGVATYRDNEDPATSPFIGSSTGASITLSIGDHTEARTSGNEEANARLIAAAPELLDALENIAMLMRATDELKRNGFASDAASIARAAIAKAKGEQV